MTNEAASLLRELHSAGQTGAIILIAILAMLGAAAIWQLYLQKRWIAMIETRILVADALREDSRLATQEITSRIDSLIKINDELRKEIDRLSERQSSLESKQLDVDVSLRSGFTKVERLIAGFDANEMAERLPEEVRARLAPMLSATIDEILGAAMARVRDEMEKVLLDPEMIVDHFRVAISEALRQIAAGGAAR